MKVTGLYKLCSPAKFYLVISVITMVMLYQNSSFNDIFCLGTFGCESKTNPICFFLNAVYVIFWILNVLC
jgi:hypothetical protein